MPDVFVALQTATIANGASLSGVVDCGDGRAVRIAMPSAWTAAGLTFQVSNDGVTFQNLYDSAGVEYAVTAAASSAIILPLEDFIGIRYLKVRSGTAGAPVNQGASRAVVLVTQGI